MEQTQKKVSLEEYIDMLANDALTLAQNLRVARQAAKQQSETIASGPGKPGPASTFQQAAKQQSETIASLEAKVKALESANKGRKGR